MTVSCRRLRRKRSRTARGIDLQQEVRIALPTLVEEGSLEDNVRAFAQSRPGPLGLLDDIPITIDLDDRPTLAAKALEKAAFVFQAEILEQAGLVIVCRELDGCHQLSQVQLGSVGTAHEVHEVPGRKQHAVLSLLHRLFPGPHVRSKMDPPGRPAGQRLNFP